MPVVHAVDDDGVCSVCPVNMFCWEGNATACPDNSASGIGSNYITDCVCEPDYSGENGGPCIRSVCPPGSWDDDGVCRKCGVGSWCDGSTENACPAFTSSHTGSDSLTNCSCLAGYAGVDGAACVGCAAGTSKTAPGAGNCSSCGVDTYSVGIAATSCSSCPARTVSASGSKHETDCICIVGHSGRNGGPCLPCRKGKYKDNIGNASCTRCAEDSYSGAIGATSPAVCVDCPRHAVSPNGSYAVQQCVCGDGYMGDHHFGCVEVSVVEFYVIIAGTVMGFDETKQAAYKQAIGASLDVNASHVYIISYDRYEAPRRKLLSETIIVQTGLTVATVNVTDVERRISSRNMESSFEEAGIGLLTVAEPLPIVEKTRPLSLAEERVLSWMGKCPCFHS
jgi:hypothetical protein